MNNELFVSLYDSLSRKLALDISDTTALRGVRIARLALRQHTAPVIVTEAVSRNSAMYAGYYPLDEDSYCAALPRHGVIRFNQFNIFNSQLENWNKRFFSGGIDRRDGVCHLQCSVTLPNPPDDSDELLSKLYYFMDVFASCLGIQIRPVSLEWYRPDKKNEGGTGD